MGIRKNPNLLEVNSLFFLKRISSKYNKQFKLADIPDKEWTAISKQGFDMIWLMGVWRRSQLSREAAKNDPILFNEYKTALKDLTEEDIGASPYAIKDYTLDPVFGKEGDLEVIKEKINSCGMKLILDFVPNHLAVDHSWTFSHPDRFINGTEDNNNKFPGTFFKVKNKNTYLAHGKDPYFPSWKDTVQLNYFSSSGREAMVRELLKVSKICDGVRCDMAMLVLNQVFQETWFSFLGSTKAPEQEFWQEAIKRVKKEYPEFIFIAEAYWDLEWILQRSGFDYTYDKKFYDRLLNANALDVKGHLQAEISYQEHSVRFIENHDEKRAAWIFGKQKAQAAAILTATVPGLHLFFDGQASGKILRVPVQLQREQNENEDPVISGFYRKLFDLIDLEVIHKGQWEMRETKTSWESNVTFNNLLAYTWENNEKILLIVVNYSAQRSQGRVVIPERFVREEQMTFKDVLADKEYVRSKDEINTSGLFVDLEPWKAHLFEIFN